jgi:hypothetical protein
MAVALFALASPLAQAEPVYFGKNVSCLSKTERTGFTVTLVPNEFPGLGRPGGIHIELNTGLGPLTAMSRGLGFKGPLYDQTIRRSGKHGQIGNWIEQDLAGDPLVLQVKLGFTTYDRIDSTTGQIAEQASSFISTVRLTRSSDYGYGRAGTEPEPGLRTRDTYLLTIDDDAGNWSARFEPGECVVEAGAGG